VEARAFGTHDSTTVITFQYFELLRGNLGYNGPPMPPPKGKGQVHPTITDAEKAWLADQARKHENVSAAWYTTMLLRYGMRHAEEAWTEVEERSKGAGNPPPPLDNA
jgi:hypothetical protein